MGSLQNWLSLFLIFVYCDFTGAAECPSAGNFNDSYTFTIEDMSCVIRYNYILSDDHQAIRVHVSSQNASSNFPVSVVVKQQFGILSWQIPLVLNPDHKYELVNRTLCPIWNYLLNASVQQEILIDLSTFSPAPVDVSLRLTRKSDFMLRFNSVFNLVAAPNQPQYYESSFPDGIDILVVSVKSDDNLCTLVSIQKIGCPVYDLEKNVRFAGAYQTMTKQAAITIQAKDYKEKKFYVVIVVRPTDYECTGVEIKEPVANRSKELTIHIYQKIKEDEYILATVGAASFFIIFYILSITIGVICFIRSYRRNRYSEITTQVLTDHHRNVSYGAITQFGANNPRCSSSGSRTAAEDNLDEEDHVDEDNQPDLEDALPEPLSVADLAKKDCKSLERQWKLFLCNTVIIALFYAPSVVQLVINNLSVQHVTGNQDICYYNFLCTYPFGLFNDFNHVFSNIGYILLGFLFIGLVRRRDILHKHKIAMDYESETSFVGIPRHFGLFYAMGVALVMEGLFSGCYHICPNYSNFKFDTSFMYVIAGICMLKIYHSRHPDISAGSYSFFLAFGIILLIGVLGEHFETRLFWIAFAIVHILSCLALSAHIYSMGCWKLNFSIFKRVYLITKTNCILLRSCFQPKYKNSFVLLTILNIVNWSFAIFGIIKPQKDFASYLLAILIVNLIMYVAFYITMKLIVKEKILLLPLVYIILSSVTWTAALYFFFQTSISWELMPAQSRTYNRPCILLNFYDEHDIWHFLSAASMFFSFMVILTLDDDLTQTKQTEIRVF